MILKEIIKGTDLIPPSELLYSNVKEICESPEECSQDSLLFITKKANGQKREIGKLRTTPRAVICERDEFLKAYDCPVIYTSNARKSLSRVYSNFCEINYEGLKLIAITGTSGKSTVSKMLEHIFAYTGTKVGLIGTGVISVNGTVISSDNYSMTTPDPKVLYPAIKRMQDEGCTHIIMETSSHALALGKLEPIKFELGIFTNLYEDHGDFHKDKEDYYKAKACLFDRCNAGLFNLDDPYSARCYREKNIKKVSVGIINKADVYATEIYTHSLSGSEYFYREEGLIFKVAIKLPGAFNVYNSLIALKCAIMLGVKPCKAKSALAELSTIDGRMEVISSDVTVVIDYAHTTEAFENALKTLKSSVKPWQKLIVVFGCGGDRDKSKRSHIGNICSRFADRLFITEDNSRTESTLDIINDIKSGIPDGFDLTVIPDRKEAIHSAITSASFGDVIAILGKGHERYIIDRNGYRPFDERKVVSRALDDRRNKIWK